MNLEVEKEAMVMPEVEGMEENMMVIIKVIPEVEVVPQAEVGKR